MLPDLLRDVLIEIATMRSSDEYYLRLAAIRAEGLVRNPSGSLIDIAANLAQIHDYLKLYDDERLRWLARELSKWIKRFTKGRFQNNPYFLLDSQSFLTDDEVRRRATEMHFTPEEAGRVVDLSNEMMYEAPNNFTASQHIFSLGKKSVIRYSAPRLPRRGDRLWFAGTPREAAPVIERLDDGARFIELIDGRRHPFSYNIRPIRSPWPPHIPTKESSIMWWDASV